MKVSIKGLGTGLTVNFYDTLSYKDLYGFYVQDEPQTFDFHGWAWAGFNGNLAITSTTDKGAGEIGSAWRGNNLGNRTINWNFANDNQKKLNGYSPAKILSALIHQKNEIMEVTVNDTYVSNFYFDPATNMENGLISLTSADTNNGTFWSKGTVTVEFNVWENYPYITKNLPQELLRLSGELLPGVGQILGEVDALNPITTIGGEVNGTWQSFRLVTTHQTISYDNSINQDKFITIDTDMLTVVNENGVDRKAEIVLESGSSIYPIVDVGLNTYELYVNNAVDFDEYDATGVPTDMIFKIEVDDLTSVIYEV